MRGPDRMPDSGGPVSLAGSFYHFELRENLVDLGPVAK